MRVNCNRRSEDPVGCGNQPQMMFDIPRTGTCIVHAVAGLKAMRHSVPKTRLAHETILRHTYAYMLPRRHQIQFLRGETNLHIWLYELSYLLRALAIINQAQGGVRVFKNSSGAPAAQIFFFLAESVYQTNFQTTYFSGSGQPRPTCTPLAGHKLYWSPPCARSCPPLKEVGDGCNAGADRVLRRDEERE